MCSEGKRRRDFSDLTASALGYRRGIPDVAPIWMSGLRGDWKRLRLGSCSEFPVATFRQVHS